MVNYKALRMFSAALTVALVFGAVGCSSPESSEQGASETSSESSDGNFTDGWYVLEKKIVDGIDVTSDFLYNCLSFNKGEASSYEVDFSGRAEKTGAYSIDGSSVNVVFGVKTYGYVYAEDAKTITYSGKVSKQEVVMTYKYDKNFSLGEGDGVNFGDELFGESKSENFYNYCPSVMMEGNDIMHIWYCANKDSGQVTDYISYRKGVLNASGKWNFGEKQIVLAPTDGTWDRIHTCDPSVVKGKFSMGGKNYSYLMAYLGVATYNCTANEVGIAVAEKPEGPWIKVDSINPIADFVHSTEYNAASWGYGQPCVISVDGEGKVLLFYTKGVVSGTGTYVEEWDLSDIDNPVKINGQKISDSGVVNASSGTDVINNADFAYDPALKRLYCIKEDFPYPESGGVNWITGSNTVLYLELGNGGIEAVFGENKWNVVGSVSAASTGFFRCHNMALVTDEYGKLINPFKLPVIFTSSDSAADYPDWEKGGQWPALHTYRLHGTYLEVR